MDEAMIRRHLAELRAASEPIAAEYRLVTQLITAYEKWLEMVEARGQVAVLAASDDGSSLGRSLPVPVPAGVVGPRAGTAGAGAPDDEPTTLGDQVFGD